MTIEWISVESATPRGADPDESAVDVHELRRALAAERTRAGQAVVRAAAAEAELRRVRRQLLAARGGPPGAVVVVLAALAVGWWLLGRAGAQ
ncbi:hypothetical protein [Frankia sp. AgB32]|uniref:hypothetical protein n=1 Tax=Frankia sp. AgB32 TaxID=631119 RepID=UPI00200D7E30|nr:hypothetical protein [Frankia sp. AgB32]MCK9897671.1 hypothetical protein [Frankia sp. AgB32]